MSPTNHLTIGGRETSGYEKSPVPKLTIFATSVAEPLAAQLPGRWGTIQSVYDKAINIEFEDGSLVSVVDERSGGGPFSITVRLPDGFTFQGSGFQPGTRVLFGKDVIQVEKSVRIKGLAECAMFDPIPRMPAGRSDSMMLTKNSSRLRIMIMQYGRAGGFKQIAECDLTRKDVGERNDMNRYVRVALPAIKGLTVAIKEYKLLEIAPFATRLVGLGPGSTPSGDDFLAGLMLGGLALSGSRRSRAKYWVELNKIILSAARGKTTPLGYEFMKYAAQGMGTEASIRLIEEMGRRENSKIEEASMKLFNLGETSGTDVAVGILASCDLAAFA